MYSPMCEGLDILKTKLALNTSKSVVPYKLEMWVNAQHDGRPAKYRWHALFNAAKLANAQYLTTVQ